MALPLQCTPTLRVAALNSRLCPSHCEGCLPSGPRRKGSGRVGESWLTPVPRGDIQVQRRGRTNGSTGTGYTNLYKTPIGRAQSSLHRAKGPCIHDILGKARDILRGFLFVPWLFKCHVLLLPLHLHPLSPSSRFVSCERVGVGNLLIYLHFHLRQPTGVRLRNSERGSFLETKCREQSKRARVSCVVQKDTSVPPYFAVSSFRSKLCFSFALSTIGVLRSAPCYTKVQHGSTSVDIQDQRHATPCMYHDPNLFRRSVVSYDRNSDTLEPSGRPGFQGLVYVSPVSLSLIHRSIEIPDSIQMLKCIKAQQQMIPLSAINLRAPESLPLR